MTNPQGNDTLPLKTGNSLKYLRVNAGESDVEWAATSGSGESNTSSNVGTGEGLAKAKEVVDLPFKSLIGQTNKIILTGNANDVTFTIGSDIVVTTDSRLSDSRTPLAHTHVKADITDFTHTHVKADITDFSHTHTASEITDYASATAGFTNKTIDVEDATNVIKQTTPAAGEYLRDNGTKFVSSSILAGDLPAAIDATKLADGTVTNTELQYINTLSSNAQTQLGTKVDTSANSGTGEGTVLKAVSGTTVTAKTLKQGTNITITNNADDITISGPAGSGEANTQTNQGTGEGTLAKTKVGVDLPIKSLKQGANITLTNNVDDVTVAVSGLAKTDISDTGTWEVTEIPTLTRAKISDFLPITTIDISDDNVTYGKIQNVVANNVILGNNAGAGGIVDELTAAEVRTIIDGANNYTHPNHSGDVTSTGDGATVIGSNKVTDAMMSTTEDAMLAGIEFIIDGGGSAITTGIKGDLEIPFNCTIEQVTLLADQSGSIVIDIWKDTYANFPPTVADTITAAAKPTITTATKSQDATLTGWTKSITKGDILRFNVDSITTVQRVTLSLRVRK